MATLTPHQLEAVFPRNRVALYAVPKLRIAVAAELLGVSDDTVRRWIDSRKVAVERDQSRVMVIDGATLATFIQDPLPCPSDSTSPIGSSARNRLVGLVTNVISDTVMTQIEVQCGPHRVVSLMSTEAAHNPWLTARFPSCGCDQIHVGTRRDLAKPHVSTAESS
jgi:excisionase family DNA binding protein